MTAFDASTPFILIAPIKVKPGKVQEYLELATKTDSAVEVSDQACCITPLIKTPRILFALHEQRSTKMMMLFLHT